MSEASSTFTAASPPQMVEGIEVTFEDQVQVSEDGKTVWVHALDGSTIGRFSKVFGMDLHTTVTEQQNGVPQCLYCTHEAPGPGDWNIFRTKLLESYGIDLPDALITFT
jgi:hypothetical protein